MATEVYALPNGTIGWFGDGARPPLGSRQLNAADVHHGRDRYNHQTGEFIRYVPVVPLIDRLNAIFSEQTVELRAQFGPLKAAVRNMIDDGDTEAAQAIIAGATIPSNLEPVRALLLAEFED